MQGEEVLTLMEMTLKNLTDGDKIDPQDFLDRVDILGALGKTVLISDFGEYHRLAAYFFRYTKKMIGVAMGVPTLKEIFDEKYYSDLSGGILESFGRMFKNDLKLYVYPLLEAKTGALITASNLRVAPNLRHLHAYLVENRLIESLRDYDESALSIFSRDVLQKIRSGDKAWEAWSRRKWPRSSANAIFSAARNLADMMQKTALLFAGQGAQYVGMGRDFAEQFPTAKKWFDRSREILGVDLPADLF